MSDPVLLVDKSEGIATLTLNRPEARNALNAALRRQVAESFQALQDDASVGVVILTGTPPAFCAGIDLKELSQTGAGGDDNFGGNDMIEAMGAFDRPIIGAIGGVAVTGGFELALACDILIGSTEARFADTHARVGILPGWGLSQILPRLIGTNRAKLVSFTGNYISAGEALHWGLLAQVVEPEELLPCCRGIGQDILSCAPGAVSGYKRMIDEGFAMPYAEARRHEVKRSREHASGVSAEQIAERRAGIQARGRAQSRR